MTTLTVRIISPTEQRNDILNDGLFQALQTAERVQIEAYLEAQLPGPENANARVIFSLLMRAVRYLVNQHRT